MKSKLAILVVLFLFFNEAKSQVTWSFDVKFINKTTFDLIVKGRVEKGIKILSIHDKKCPLGFETYFMHNIEAIENAKEIIVAAKSSVSNQLVYQDKIEYKKRYQFTNGREKGFLQIKTLGCEELRKGESMRAFGIENCYTLRVNETSPTLYVGHKFNLRDNCEEVQLVELK